MEIQLNGKAMTLNVLPLHEIKPYENNIKIHPVKQLEGLTQSIERFGFKQPIVVDKNNVIVAGHARYEAAAALGYADLLCVLADDLTDEEINAYRILDNEIAKAGTTDFAALEIELAKIPDFDFSIFNVEFPEIEKINEGLTDEDDAPELKIEATSKPGDVWILGDHRVMCGDAVKIDDVEKLMNGEKADMVFTSPPYNGKTHLSYGKGKDNALYENNELDSKTSEEYVQFCHDALTTIFINTCGFIFWNVNYNANSRFEYIKGIEPFLENLWETIVWKKAAMPVAHGMTRNFEFIFLFKSNANKKHINEEFKTSHNFWDIANNGSQIKEHHACFPVALPTKGIELATTKGDSVLDLFGGSGSTLIACQKTNRKCFMMEIAPNYVDVIIKRWQQFTGKDAHLETTGETFNQLSPLV